MTPDTATAPAKVPMVQRNVRVPLDLWDGAAAKGAQEDPPRGISDIVRDQLAEYVGASA
jgi:hypothetical protein